MVNSKLPTLLLLVVGREFRLPQDKLRGVVGEVGG
jgi:hypothetical protein